MTTVARSPIPLTCASKLCPRSCLDSASRKLSKQTATCPFPRCPPRTPTLEPSRPEEWTLHQTRLGKSFPTTREQDSGLSQAVDFMWRIPTFSLSREKLHLF